MKKQYLIEGMSCYHCRSHAEEALNSLAGVKVAVTLDPPVAEIEFMHGELSLAELQKPLDDLGYTIKEA